MQNKENLIWIDLEMTGLNVDVERIIEIATIVTDTNLNILAEGPVLALSQPPELLQNMDEWNTKQHYQSGLINRVEQSQITDADAQAQTLAFVEQWVPANCSPMCGNSIGTDRTFLRRYMPQLEQYFHYRNLNVTTLKLLAQRWAPSIANGIQKESQHLALADIKDSINELRYYRQHFLKIPTR